MAAAERETESRVPSGDRVSIRQDSCNGRLRKKEVIDHDPCIHSVSVRESVGNGRLWRREGKSGIASRYLVRLQGPPERQNESVAGNYVVQQAAELRAGGPVSKPAGASPEVVDRCQVGSRLRSGTSWSAHDQRPRASKYAPISSVSGSLLSFQREGV